MSLQVAGCCAVVGGMEMVKILKLLQWLSEAGGVERGPVWYMRVKSAEEQFQLISAGCVPLNHKYSQPVPVAFFFPPH